MTQISLPHSTTLTSCDVFQMPPAGPIGRLRSLTAATRQNGFQVNHSTSAQNGSVLTPPRRSSFLRNFRAPARSCCAFTGALWVSFYPHLAQAYHKVYPAIADHVTVITSLTWLKSHKGSLLMTSL